MEEKKICPVKRIKKPSMNVKVTNESDDMINIDANIKIKNPIIWLVDKIEKKKGKLK